MSTFIVHDSIDLTAQCSRPRGLADVWVTLVYRRVVSEEVLAGSRFQEVEERGRLDPYHYTVTTSPQWFLHCKMGSDESQFNISLTEGDKVTITAVSTDHSIWKEGRAEAESNRIPSACLYTDDSDNWMIPSSRRSAIRIQNLYTLWITYKFALRLHKRN